MRSMWEILFHNALYIFCKSLSGEDMLRELDYVIFLNLKFFQQMADVF